MPPHVLVIGGTGILSPAVRVLVDRGSRVSVVSRSGHGVPAGADAVVADVTEVAALAAALDLAIGERGPLGLALAYQPFAPAGAWTVLASRVCGPLVALLTSGHAAPRDAPAPPLPEGIAQGAEVWHLLLGWCPPEAGLPARWHTPREISAAALDVAGTALSTASPEAAAEVTTPPETTAAAEVTTSSEAAPAPEAAFEAEVNASPEAAFTAEATDAAEVTSAIEVAGAAGENAGGPASGMRAPEGPVGPVGPAESAGLVRPVVPGVARKPVVQNVARRPAVPGMPGKPAVLGVVRPWDERPGG